MINQQTLKGNWHEIEGKIRSKWGQLSDDELTSFNGNIEQLIGLIQRKTGEARHSIEEFLDEATRNGAGGIMQATDAAREFAENAAERVQEGTREAVESLRQHYDDAEEMIRQRPSESAMVCFGAGIVTGFLAALLLRRA